MTYLPENAFRDCTRLEGVSVPLVTTIGKSAFESCSSLTTVVFEHSAENPSQLQTDSKVLPNSETDCSPTATRLKTSRFPQI